MGASAYNIRVAWGRLAGRGRRCVLVGVMVLLALAGVRSSRHRPATPVPHRAVASLNPLRIEHVDASSPGGSIIVSGDRRHGAIAPEAGQPATGAVGAPEYGRGGSSSAAAPRSPRGDSRSVADAARADRADVLVPTGDALGF